MTPDIGSIPIGDRVGRAEGPPSVYDLCLDVPLAVIGRTGGTYRVGLVLRAVVEASSDAEENGNEIH